MMQPYHQHTLILTLFLISSFSFVAYSISPRERIALVSLFEDIGYFPNNNTNTSSLSDPCHWRGVKCDGNNVTGLSLSRISIANVTEVGHLPNLQSLTITSSNLSGSGILRSMCKLRKLVWASLVDNDIHSSIPNCLGDLKSLNGLSLPGNYLFGTIPPELVLLPLQYLNLSSNRLTGQLPLNSSLPDHSVFDFSDNSIEQPLPQWCEHVCVSSVQIYNPPSFNISKGGNMLEKITQRSILVVLIPSITVIVVFISVVAIYLYLKTRKNSKQVEMTSLSTSSDYIIPSPAPTLSSSTGTTISDALMNIPPFTVLIDDTYFTDRSEITIATAGPIPVSIRAPEPIEDDVYLTGVVKGNYLGKGVFGTVYSGTWQGVTVAMKTVDDPSRTPELVREAQLLSSLRHVNIISFFGLYRDPSDSSLFIVTEFMKDGSLLDVLRSSRPSDIPMHTMMQIARDIAAGMLHLEQKNIIHFDLAARNVLVSKRGDSFDVKVSDFGLSKTYLTTKMYSRLGPSDSEGLPLRWAAPEVLLKDKLTTKGDVWSYGVMLYEMMTFGALPYAGSPFSNETLDWIIAGNRLNAPDAPKPIADLMIQTFNIDPAMRPSFADIVAYLSTLIDGS